MNEGISLLDLPEQDFLPIEREMHSLDVTNKKDWTNKK